MLETLALNPRWVGFLIPLIKWNLPAFQNRLKHRLAEACRWLDKYAWLPGGLRSWSKAIEGVRGEMWELYRTGAYEELLVRLPQTLRSKRGYGESELGELEHLLGLTLEHAGRPAEALALFGSLIERGRDDFWVRMHRARLFRVLGQPREAAVELEVAHAYDPNSGELAHERRRQQLFAMRELYRSGAYDELLAELPEVLKANRGVTEPEVGELEQLLELVLEQAGRRVKALSESQRPSPG